MKRCYCPSCRARDAERFQRIIDANYSRTAATLILIRETDRAISSTVAARCNAYGRRRLDLPAIPEWEGEPTELDF